MGKTSLNELMGKSGERAKGRKLTLDDLGELLGERLPEFSPTPVGRLRLTTALRNRFGEGWRNLPGMSDIMKEFEKESEFAVKLAQMKLIKGKR